MSDFWDLILDAALDALIDTAKMLPFLFAVYLLIEYLEHKASDKFAGALRRLGPFGPVGGAVLGCIPQCGFSVAVSNLYSGRLVSLGTLLAVYIATSDEAVPILLSDPTKISSVGMLIAAKLVIAIAAGLLTDLAVKVFHKKKNVDNAPYEDLCRDCGCDEHGILYSATKHTVQIFLFLLAVSFVLGIAIGRGKAERHSHDGQRVPAAFGCAHRSDTQLCAVGNTHQPVYGRKPVVRVGCCGTFNRSGTRTCGAL